VAGDVPEWFYWNIKAIDPHLYFVYHPWKIMYDNVMNEYEGAIDDGRFRIQEWHGQLSFGYPLKRSDCDGPIEEAKWHLWRLCWPHGWCHVTPLEAVEPEYLVLLSKRLYLQATISDKYSQKEYAKMTLKQQHEARIKKQDEADQLYADVQKENSWLVNSAMENFASGKTAPSNPTKEIITNINPKKIVRPLHDTEGGLYLPDEWKTDE
jgi:hypothetical protein